MNAPQTRYRHVLLQASQNCTRCSFRLYDFEESFHMRVVNHERFKVESSIGDKDHDIGIGGQARTGASKHFAFAQGSGLRHEEMCIVLLQFPSRLRHSRGELHRARQDEVRRLRRKVRQKRANQVANVDQDVHEHVQHLDRRHINGH
jgi:hypothetical protein